MSLVIRNLVLGTDYVTSRNVKTYPICVADLPSVPGRRTGFGSVRYRVRGQAQETGLRRRHQSRGEESVPTSGGVATQARSSNPRGGCYC